MDGQEIRDWSVAGDDRIVGNVHTHPGQLRGRTIITSPVVQVRFIGERQLPVAVTESGSCYLLGAPAHRFGPAQADVFIRRLSACMRPAGAPRRDEGTQCATRPLPHAPPVCGPALSVSCAACGVAAVATLAQEIRSVNAAGGIRIDDPCPRCAGVLGAPPGRYALNEAAGILERVGDLRPDAPQAVQRSGMRARGIGAWWHRRGLDRVGTP